MYYIESHIGKNIGKYVELIAAYRIEFFKQFPYLYEGTKHDEEQYLEGMLKEDKSLLILIFHNHLPIGISTSYPLTIKGDLLTTAHTKFRNSGKNPEDYFYFSELIIREEHRHKGLARKVHEAQVDYAKSLGHRNVCFASVVRENDDIRKPENYTSINEMYEKLGFNKTNIFIEHLWPTIQADSSIEILNNKLVFWEKKI